MINTNARTHAHSPAHQRPAAWSAPVLWGLAGGLAGTVVMDVILMASFWLAGSDPLGCFSTVGKTMRLLLGLPAGEGLTAVLAGVETHYLVGPALGLLFGALVRRVSAFRSASLKRTLVIAVLYVELISQPMLVTVPIYLALPLAGILRLYAISTAMHVICGLLLGAIVWHGPRWGMRPHMAEQRVSGRSR